MRKVLSILSVVLLLNGCSAGEAPQGKAKDKIVVAHMPIPDNAALFVAIKRGFFDQEGLSVEHQEIRGTAEAVPKLLSGAWQFALVNYVSFFQLEEEKPGALRLVADAYAARNNNFLMMVKKGSPIKSLKDLTWSGAGAKKKVGVATPNSVATLTTEMTLQQEKGLSKDDIEFVFVKLPDMPLAVERGLVDVGWETEPYITDSQTKYGAVKLADAASGLSDQFPIAGYAVSTAWVEKDREQVRHRKDVVARFQRAISRGQEIVARDRTAVTEILPTYAHIDKEKASVIALGSFPTTMEPARYQRVADAMHTLKYFRSEKKIKAEDVIWRDPLASSSPSTSSLSGAAS
jgi:NitT/TauT family transport system substrate-binding protein